MVLLLITLGAAGPLQTVKTGAGELDRLISARADKARLVVSAAKLFDARELARRALGPAWSDFTAPQQAQLSADLQRLLGATWAQRALAASAEKRALRFEAEQVSGDEATVDAALAVRGRDVPVRFSLQRAGATWRVYDVTADGVSALDGYTQQLRSLLSAKGVERTLAIVHERAGPLEPAPAPRQKPIDPFELLIGAAMTVAPPTPMLFSLVAE